MSFQNLQIIHIDTMIIARKFLIMIMIRSEKLLILKMSKIAVLSYIIFNMIDMIYLAACRYMCNDSKIKFCSRYCEHVNVIHYAVSVMKIFIINFRN